jgi:hypothetical protein
LDGCDAGGAVCSGAEGVTPIDGSEDWLGDDEPDNSQADNAKLWAVIMSNCRNFFVIFPANVQVETGVG